VDVDSNELRILAGPIAGRVLPVRRVISYYWVWERDLSQRRDFKPTHRSLAAIPELLSGYRTVVEVVASEGQAQLLSRSLDRYQKYLSNCQVKAPHPYCCFRRMRGRGKTCIQPCKWGCRAAQASMAQEMPRSSCCPGRHL
jgi:hypothetical protein